MPAMKSSRKKSAVVEATGKTAGSVATESGGNSAGAMQVQVPEGVSLLRGVAVFSLVFAVSMSFFASGYFLGFGSGPVANTGVVAISQGLSGVALQGRGLGAKINIVSVTSDGQGALNEGSVEIIPGNGKILLSLNPFSEPDTQDSVQTAALVAQKFTGKSLSGSDVIFSVNKTDAKLIGGPSAGAAFTVATIAALEGKTVRSDAALTGTINSDGSIGQIGGVIEKATAAADKNLSIFLVPKGQKVFTVYQQVRNQQQRGNVTIISARYVPQIVDLQDYLDKEGYKMKVEEVSSINEAVGLMLA
ncbi:Archaeal Lon protease [uncultured archaeon]|nr:Archaeal Lon protease [uncultured archaeon]